MVQKRGKVEFTSRGAVKDAIADGAKPGEKAGNFLLDSHFISEIKRLNKSIDNLVSKVLGPEAELVMKERNKEQRLIEQLLDQFLNFAGASQKSAKYFHKLNGYYRKLYRAEAEEYDSLFKKMYDDF